MSKATLGELERQLCRLHDANLSPSEAIRGAEAPLREYLCSPSLPLNTYERQTLSPYARYLLSSPSAPVQIVLACWKPGHDSPIHNHQQLAGLVTVLTGQVTEIKYELRQESTAENLWRIMSATPLSMQIGEFSPILPHNGMQVHRMFNPSNETAFTLHCYFGKLERLDRFLPVPGGLLQAHARDLWFDD